MNGPGSGRLNAFGSWLRARRLAPEHRIPYLEMWVECFRHPAKVRPPEPRHDTLRILLDDLNLSGTPDWHPPLCS